MSEATRIVTRTGIRRVAVGCIVAIGTLAVTAGAALATTAVFATAPALPTLSG